MNLLEHEHVEEMAVIIQTTAEDPGIAKKQKKDKAKKKKETTEAEKPKRPKIEPSDPRPTDPDIRD